MAFFPRLYMNWPMKILPLHPFGNTVNIMTKISVAKGDGIGKEIMDAVLHIFDAAQVPLEYDFVEMGKDYFLQGFSS